MLGGGIPPSVRCDGTVMQNYSAQIRCSYYAHLFSCRLDSRTVQYRIGREEHIQRKIDLMVTEAKTKMGKKDKKGEW